ncbi:uncharacterized protein LOC123193644 [Mangifera indica]|uniref:uncharacterized protein LOC123193644 n=1 Tax=Mangifera indica TaxID=29780 RepID=UPI001CFAE726|nr:uncharacterized protein LOC123193644 [Mangifera indica]
MGETHPSHPEHELEFKNFKKIYTCDGCKQRGFGSRYRCDLCDFDLHTECMVAKPTAHHDFLENSAFKLLYEPPPVKKCFCEDDCRRCCDACGQPVKGFVYHDEKNNWDLHPCCQKLPCEEPSDGVLFKLSEKALSECYFCNKTKRECTASQIEGWSYVSKCKKFNIHVNCLTKKILEGRENRAYQDDNSLALQKLEFSLQRQNRNRRNGNKFVRIMKILFKTIAAILLGDPTIGLTCLVVELLAK